MERCVLAKRNDEYTMCTNEVFNVSHLMFSYENISFVYKVHSPQLNTEQSQLEWRVQDSYKQLFKSLTNSCLRLLQTVV